MAPYARGPGRAAIRRLGHPGFHLVPPGSNVVDVQTGIVVIQMPWWEAAHAAQVRQTSRRRMAERAGPAPGRPCPVGPWPAGPPSARLRRRDAADRGVQDLG